MSLRHSSALVLASSLLLAAACSAGPADPSTIIRGGTQSGGGSGPVTSNGNAGNSLVIGVDQSGGKTGRDPDDKRDVPVRDKVCDAAGKCTCLKLALLGTLTSAAADPDTTAFTTWLSDKSDGSAVATNVPTKPAVDAAFLANYDILLVANVNGWTFSADEKAAVEKWVGDGGGIITLTGFTSTATEAADTSQLISFAGMNYEGTSEAQWAAPKSGEQQPVYYKGGNVDLKLCMNYSGSTTTGHAQPFITTPLKFTPQPSPLDKLTANLDYVGAFIGWAIKAPADATVLTKDPVTGGNMAVVKEYKQKGRIFAYGDEWVTFTNEWAQDGTPVPPQMDASNHCWVPPSGDAAGFFHSVQTLYQTKQFWYNAINWVAPPNSCFTIVDEGVVPVVK